MDLISESAFSNTVRVVEIDGQPWFVAMDVTNVLGITEKARGYAVARLADDERSLYQIQKGQRSVSIISESGLYKLIMRSDKPEARKFQDWVTREVLPAIRKDGMYVAGEEKVKTGERMAHGKPIISTVETNPQKLGA
ncbi:Bro-N domain-containing protein [Rhizobium sp. CSW-27]|uniref:BRO-N domain-containing protein n=1 Tax=Rhizobium sp. CSW-27 TaxID=2839985 RepID=UPI001C014CAE|nr:Bro-N domain-containing protein [Rhizobium sp. CSW-27]MBT9368315.1 Bro-N domain-containing protein [Rhizobium sp. CSW-27]